MFILWADYDVTWWFVPCALSRVCILVLGTVSYSFQLSKAHWYALSYCLTNKQYSVLFLSTVKEFVKISIWGFTNFTKGPVLASCILKFSWWIHFGNCVLMDFWHFICPSLSIICLILESIYHIVGREDFWPPFFVVWLVLFY